METTYHVNVEVRKGVWHRDFDPSNSLEEAKDRIAQHKIEASTKSKYKEVGMIRIGMGEEVRPLGYRIKKVISEIVEYEG